MIDTLQAAYYVCRAVDTLRDCAASPDAPLQPIRGPRGGPLRWRVADIRAHLGIPA